MPAKRILVLTAEIVLLVLVFLLIIGPMMSLFIWSVAHRWYWPNTLPQEVGFEYWKQALGMRTSLAIGAISIIPAFLLSLTIAVVVVIISMLIAIPAGYALAKYRIPFGAVIMFLFLMPNAFPQQPIFVNLLRSLHPLGPVRNRSGSCSGAYPGGHGLRCLDYERHLSFHPQLSGGGSPERGSHQALHLLPHHLASGCAGASCQFRLCFHYLPG